MKQLITTISAILLASSILAQGSGNSLLFNGTSNYVQIPHNSLFSSHASGEITVEAWVKVLAVNTDGHGQPRQPIVVKGNSGQWEWALYVYDNLSVGFSTWQCSGGGHSERHGGTIALNEWHHIAGSFIDGVSNNVYLDGMLVASGTSFNGTACTGTRPVRIGSREDGQYLNAEIDEVRIWNKALTQTEIRENMCQRLTGTEAGLTAYYRMDEGIDNSCSGGQDVCDLSPNNFHGTKTNNPTWQISGAAIGDTSIYNYPQDWALITMYLESPENDTLSVSNVSGNPNGIHIYHVNSVPNTTNGIVGLGSNDHYYGVFKTGGSSPTYTATYYYRENDSYQAGALEPGMAMYKRSDNSDGIWIDASATLNTTSKTLTATAQSTEFILANNISPLPIELLYFKATVENNQLVKVEWSTASEINNSYFAVLRSKDGYTFEEIDTIQGAGNSSSTLNYLFYDKRPYTGYTYYKLKQTDYDGKYSYSNIDVVYISPSDILKVYPNPTNGKITIVLEESYPLTEIKVSNALGQEVLYKKVTNTQQFTLDIEGANGIYTIKLNGGNKTTVLKILKYE